MMLLLFKDPDRHLLEQTGCRNIDILKSKLTSILAPHLILFSYKILMLQGRSARFSGTTQLPVCLTKSQQTSALLMHSMLKAYGKKICVKLRIKIAYKRQQHRAALDLKNRIDAFV